MGRDPTDDGSFAAWLPERDESGNLTLSYEVRNVHNEVSIASAYGVEGTLIKLKIHQVPDISVETLSPGDPIKIQTAELDFMARVKNITYGNKTGRKDSWHMLVTAYSESTWNMRRNPILTYQAGKGEKENVFDLVKKLIDISFKDTPDTKPLVLKGKGAGIYHYNALFNDGEQNIGELIEDLVEENKMEWYCDSAANEICLGTKVRTSRITPQDLNDFANRVKHFYLGDNEFLSFLCSGTAAFTVGSRIIAGGRAWKVVRSIYGERGNTAREVMGYAILEDDVCTKKKNIWIRGKSWDDRIGHRKEKQMKIVDVLLSKNDSGDLLNFYEETNQAIWNRKRYGKADSLPKDFREREILKGDEISNVVMSSLFAGDGVGLRVPVPDEGRGLLIFPDKKIGYSMLGPMVWKNDDQMPTCEPKDLYLRMEKGSLYFDEDNEYWLLKANNIKFEADSPDAANTKPDPTTTTGTFIKIENGGDITLEVGVGNTINLGKNASTKIALADHKHSITFGQTITPGVTTQTAVLGVSDSNSTKSEAE